MRKIAFIVMLFVIAAASNAAEAPGQAPYTMLLVLPSAPGPETQQKAMVLINAIITLSPPKTRLVVFSGPDRQRLAEAEIPDAPPAGRVRLLRQPLADVVKHLQKPAGSVRTGAAADTLDFPGFLGTAASLIKTAPGQTRLVLVGSPYHTDEKAATFTRGQVPSVDHILALSKESPFGTRDLKAALEGVRVDWLVIDPASTTRERSHISGFWSAYFSTHLGASLCTFLDSPKDVAERCATNAGDPVPSVKLEPTGALRILKIDALKDAAAPAAQHEGQSDPKPTTAVAKPFDAPADVTRLIEPRVAMVVLVDGSQSMQKPLESAAGLSLELARLGAELSPTFELGVIVHRGTDRFSTWSGPIERRGADGAHSKGEMALSHFIEEPSVDVERLADAVGERPGKTTGVKDHIKPFEPVTTQINIENALTTALKKLSELQSDRKVLVVVGDAGPSEFDLLDGVSGRDKESEARALRAVQDFLRANPDTRIVAVFTGPRESDAKFTADHADAIRFFKELSAMAGDRGKFTLTLNDMPDLTKRAILNP